MCTVLVQPNPNPYLQTRKKPKPQIDRADSYHSFGTKSGHMQVGYPTPARKTRPSDPRNQNPWLIPEDPALRARLAWNRETNPYVPRPQPVDLNEPSVNSGPKPAPVAPDPMFGPGCASANASRGRFMATRRHAVDSFLAKYMVGGYMQRILDIESWDRREAQNRQYAQEQRRERVADPETDEEETSSEDE